MIDRWHGTLLLLCAAITCAAQSTPKPQESFAPYWTAEPGWETEIQLRNNLAAGQLTVTPVLRSSEGKEITLDPVVIPSHQAASVDVGSALVKHSADLTNQPFSFGSVTLRYTALHVRNLSAALMIHMHGQPIGYHIDAYPISSKSVAGSVEGIWWQPHSGVKYVLAFSNSSNETVRGTLLLFDSAGKRWSKAAVLAPHQTQRMAIGELLKLAGLGGSYGGFQLLLPTNAQAIDSVHFLYDESVGFSALMKTFDHNPNAKLEERTWAGNKQWTSWAPMLALRTPDPATGFPAGTVLDPIVLLRNTTSKRAVARVTLTWRGESGKGKATLPELTLSPFETRMLDVGSMQKQFSIPDDAHWALVTLTSPAAPDDLIAVASSYDSSGRYGAQTPFSDNLASYWAGGQFQVDSTHNALVAVTNGGTRTTDALLTIHYDQGRKQYEMQQSIQPGDQMWLNFADLIQHAVPDRKGHVLPTDLTGGTYELEDLNPGLGGNLIEGKVSLDKTWGHLAYGCLTCCGYTPYLSPLGLALIIAGDGGIDAYGTNNCTGVNGYSLHNYYNQSNARWWSGNNATATVTSFNGHGVAAGSTNGYATATVPNGDGGYPKNPCPQLTQEGQNANRSRPPPPLSKMQSRRIQIRLGRLAMGASRQTTGTDTSTA